MGVQVAPYESAVRGKDMPNNTAVSCARMAELIEMPFGLWTLVGPRNHVLDVGPDRPKRRGNFWGKDIPGHAR